MAEQVGKFLTELPELETPTDGDLMYIVDDETTSKKVTMANLKRVLGGNVTGTVEGASVSFSDGADGIPMEECEVTLVPTQDLHGYSKPWAGGAGKNKANVTLTSGAYYNVQFNVDSIGRITANSVPSSAISFPVAKVNLVAQTSYILSGGVDLAYRLYIQVDGEAYTSSSSESNVFTPTTSGEYDINLVATTSASVGDTVSPMIRISTEPDSTYEPYSNICPISGHTDVTVTVASTSGGSGEDYTVSLGATYYGGNVDVTTGELEVTWGNIASYAGETLPGEWLSSLDEYTALGTPTTGAQVVYELATPQTFTLTKEQIQTLLGQNYVSHDGGGNIKVVYIRDLDIVINDLIDRVTALENE